MSRCILDDEDRMIQVLIGWDPGMQSFFARVRDRNLFLKEKRTGKPESEAGVRLWTGGFDLIWTTPRSADRVDPALRRPARRRAASRGIACGPSHRRRRPQLLALQGRAARTTPSTRLRAIDRALKDAPRGNTQEAKAEPTLPRYSACPGCNARSGRVSVYGMARPLLAGK